MYNEGDLWGIFKRNDEIGGFTVADEEALKESRKVVGKLLKSIA